MVDVYKYLRLAFFAFLAFAAFSIAAQPGWSGKIFVLILVVAGYLMFKNVIFPPKAPKALDMFYDKLKRACKRNYARLLRNLILKGDAANASLYKGKIIGGPIPMIHKKLPAEHPKKIKFIVLYTPDTGWMFKIPPFSWIMNNFRREYLFGIFHNPLNPAHSQLVSEIRLKSSNPADWHYHFMGDIEVRGVASIPHGQIEYMSDEYLDPDFENDMLYGYVKDLTLQQFLNDFTELQTQAIRSDATHQKLLDYGNYYGGEAKPQMPEKT